MPLDREVGLGPGDIVLDGDTAPSPHNFWPIYYGQTTGCTRIRRGTEVDLSARDIMSDGDPVPPKRGTGGIVLDGDPASAPTPPRKGVQPPIFGRCPLWLNG